MRLPVSEQNRTRNLLPIMNLFGKAKAKPNPKDAIVKLRESLEMLEKREVYLQTKIDNELKIAKLNASKNKRMALMALKRKKGL
jgi:charged multivesicular body protein 4A/B